MKTETSIVIQLQELASDGTNSLADVLRKALLISSKLGLKEFKEWVQDELNGYKEHSVPEYRKIRGELKAYNPLYGLITFMVPAKIAEIVQPLELVHSVEHLEMWLKTEKDKGYVALGFNPMQEETLMKMQGVPTPLKPLRVVGLDQISAILAAIRNRLVEWSLNLEEQGILGEGMTFSAKDKAKAEMNPAINIERIQNFQGLLGPVTDSTVSQTMSMTVHSGDFESLAKYLKTQGVLEQNIEELKKAIQKDPKPSGEGKFGKEVGKWVGKMVGFAADGTWHIALGTASHVLALAIGKYYGM